MERSRNGELPQTFTLPDEIRDEAVQEFISRKPGFLISYGTTMFLLLLFLIVIACWFIQYPDAIPVVAKLQSLNAPETVVNKSSGKLIKLFAKEGDIVNENAIIGYMESTAEPEQVLHLSHMLDSISALVNNNRTALLPAYINTIDVGNLGELQQSYQTFMQAFLTFKDYIGNGSYARKKEMPEHDNTVSQQKIILGQALNTLKSEVNDWVKKYLLLAPVAGRVFFTDFFQENQQLELNQTICYIKPDTSAYYAKVYIPQPDFSKTKIGQRVLLKFQAYPFEQYGSVEGKLVFISSMPTDSGYAAKVELPEGLITNYGKQLQYRDGLISNAQIITQNMRLLQRFYYSVYKQVK